ncbi:L10-interacting MYB domain-containing protein-like [Lactuca sativa]|uniref:L10-interacting MYB domain-containing protein-like n=1 Tax=Lactuca sativa TaxID=4236 RepID=UPI0022AE8FAD|nr:L10-interacting MYB domain-containing protein-like [Lactuca sativa]
MAMAQKRPRINWKQIEGVEKTFLEACIHEITTYGREGSSLKASSWKNVAERLKTEYNFVVDQKQMKNRYDYLKAKFGAWLKLKNKTGNVYNPITNTFNMEEDEWQLEIKLNKMVETLRTSPLVYPDLCVQLFDGSAGCNWHSWMGAIFYTSSPFS